MPVFEDIAVITRAGAMISDPLARGEGIVGRLLADDTLVRMRNGCGPAGHALAQGEAALGDLRGLMRSASAVAQGLPRLVATAEGALTNLRHASGDLARASPQAPRLARDAAASLAVLPGLLVQVQQATAELEQLVIALRAHPLIGGGRISEQEPRVPAREIRP